MSAFLAFLLAALMSIASLVFINADQTYIMVDILDYPRDQVGSAAGTLVFADELCSMFMVSVWGALSDRIARRWIFATGLTLMAIGTFLHPWARSVFPSTASAATILSNLLVFRLIFAMGGSAATAMLTAFIGDYSRDVSRSKVAGITGVATGLGALFAALVLSRLPTFFTRDSSLVPGKLREIPNGGATLVISFAIASVLQFITAVIALVFLVPPPPSQDDQDETAETLPGDTARTCRMPMQSRSIGLLERIKIGIMAAKDPFILLAYLSGFVARADSIALTLFVAPWVDKYLTAEGLCPAPVSADGALTRCQPAKRLASTLMGIAHICMLIGAPVFGVLSDRIGAVRGVAIPAAIGFLAFGFLGFLVDPHSPWVYGGMAAAGLADIGMIIGSMALLAGLGKSQHRGALAGVYSFFGALGIIVTSKAGGYLFDAVRATASFWIVAVISGLVSCYAIVLVCTAKNRR